MGGYKVVYQYAKRMVEDNYDVHIYFLMLNHKYEIKTILKKIQGSLIKRKKYRKVDWFDLKGVKLHFDQSIEDVEKISHGKIIATHWSTANIVYNSRCNDKEKFYFIQGYELFDPQVTKKVLDDTWKLPLKKIVVSKWLMKKGIELGVLPADLIYVPNFVDEREFPTNKNENYKRNCVSFLWHTNPRKQAKMGLSVVMQLKNKFPQLNFVMFGENINISVPKDIKTIENANLQQLNDIYRHSIVYFMPSRKEGWGLTGMEAMACGAAVVSIDNGGIWEYADNDSAVIVDNDKEQLEKAIIKLINNPSFRTKIVNSAYRNISEFTFKKSYKRFLRGLGI